VLVSCAFVIGCDEQTAPTEALAPEFVVAGESGCYTVKYTDDLVATPAGLRGVLGGDLQGTTVWAGDPSTPIKLAGVSVHVDGFVTYNITGGIIPELKDESFTVTARWLNVLAPPVNPPLVFKNEGNYKALDGVAKANLKFHGETVAGSGISHLEVTGVICP
jgi:hypothetical protein